MTRDTLVEALRALTEEFVRAEARRLRRVAWWRAPLLATTTIDRRFDKLAKITTDDHFHPRDLLPTARSVVVFFIPFERELVKVNKQGGRPCREWGLAYVETNNLIGRLSQTIGDFLVQYGFKSALTPTTHNFDEVNLMARWSHKHLGYLAGLGRFGVHRMLITPVGCTGRLGSLVTEADLGDHPLIKSNEACLSRAGHKCGQCVGACPVEALSVRHFDRQRCWNRLRQNRSDLGYLSDLPETTHVCGKCAALMPCSFTNPVAAL